MHSPKVTRRAACLGTLAGAVAPVLAQPGTNLKYQQRDRGRYNEGTRGAPSTGVPLDLIAALVDPSESYRELPAQFQAVVFVAQPQPVYLTIREIEPDYYYWLDTPPEYKWEAGKVNRFQWSTRTVIRYLTWQNRALGLNDLGAVARLGSESPRTPDVVAPVALCYSHPPAEVLAYRFVFRPGAKVHLTFTLSAVGKNAPLSVPQVFPELGANEAQAVLWKSAAWPDGWYEIAISGYKLSDNTRVDERVRFYHRRTLGV